ncbi:MAG: ASKHA domain-containing protein [Peptostreptococcaceae bacterium]
MEYVNIKIHPENIEIKVKKNSKLIDILYENDKHIDAICGGVGICRKCKVRLIKGRTGYLNDNKLKKLSSEEIDSNIILACESIVNEDIEIELQTNKNNLTKGEVTKNVTKLNPIVSKKCIKLSHPTLNDRVSDEERILRELEENVQIETNLLPKLYNVLNEANYEVTLTIYDKKIINIEKGDCTQENYAIAIDLGTTTVAGYLINLNTGNILSSYSTLNLQKTYGADIISRINYSMEGNENIFKLKKLAIKSIDNIISKLLQSCKISSEDINIIGLIGNTTMSHLLIGTSLEGIAKSPFTPVFTSIVKCNSNFLGIKSLNNEKKCIIFPNIGGYVGSDTLGVVIGTEIINKTGNHLAIDIGTNCELVLKTNDRVLTCSTAAGPAFEGANMKYGMRAEEGAIYSCNIDDDIEIKIIGNKVEKGICGSGYIDIIAKLVDKGIIKKQGRILDADKVEEKTNKKIAQRIKKQGNMNKVILSDSNNEEVSIYQEDISNLQLAKGAVNSGIEIMMEEANVKYLDKIYLSGAFGSNLDIYSLKRIKMIPDIEDCKIEVVGNAAATGLINILISKDIYNELVNITKAIEHMELANHKDFNNKFTKSMRF